MSTLVARVSGPLIYFSIEIYRVLTLITQYFRHCTHSSTILTSFYHARYITKPTLRFPEQICFHKKSCNWSSSFLNHKNLGSSLAGSTSLLVFFAIMISSFFLLRDTILPFLTFSFIYSSGRLACFNISLFLL